MHGMGFFFRGRFGPSSIGSIIQHAYMPCEPCLNLGISAPLLQELEAKYTEEQKARSEAERLIDGHMQEIKVLKGLLDASRLEAKKALEVRDDTPPTPPEPFEHLGSKYP